MSVAEPCEKCGDWITPTLPHQCGSEYELSVLRAQYDRRVGKHIEQTRSFRNALKDLLGCVTEKAQGSCLFCEVADSLDCRPDCPVQAAAKLLGWSMIEGPGRDP